MTESRPSASRLGSSALVPTSYDLDSGAVRPRNRRLISAESDAAGGLSAYNNSSSLFSSFSASSSRNPSPIPISSTRSNVLQETRSASNPPIGRDPTAGPGNTLGMLESSLAQSWSSFQGFASSLMSGDGATVQQSASRHGRVKRLQRDLGHSQQRKAPDSWGPSPPDSRPSAQDIAVGSLAERQAALKAARTASVLESHEGVNGGLDITGNYKRRNSDDLSSSAAQEEPAPDQLVYIHHVQPNDTFAGIILKYRCREDAFRKLNGLWSRDIQMRKWLALPVNFCEVRGRATEQPSHFNKGGVDHLASTPETSSTTQKRDDTSSQQPDFFSLSRTNSCTASAKAEEPENKPWEHVRWCSLDSFPQPVEIARVSKKSMGYFPPRRKKSLHTVSNLSTPRQSLDNSAAAVESYTNSPDRDSGGGGGVSSRRLSMLSNRTGQPGTPGRSTPTSSQSRVGSAGADSRPAWMRRPGGVGSMGKGARAPGPERDLLNSWAKRHLPGIAIDEYLPSISVMGSETAHFGFDKQQEHDTSGIVESPFDEGQDMASASRQGSGLDRAAAQVETWLRGAFVRRPSTPRVGPVGRGGRLQEQAEDSDLIELTDTNSDDGRSAGFGLSGGSAGLLDQTVASSGWAPGDGSARGIGGMGGLKGQKDE